MAIDINIAGTSYASGTGYEIPWQSVAFDEDPANSSSDAEFDVIIHGVNGAPAIGRPKGGQEVIITNSGTRIFGGRIIGPLKETPYQGMPTDMKYHVKCADYRRWFSRHVIIDEYPSETASSRIQRIVSFVNGYSPPVFTVNNVNLASNPVLPGRRYNGIAPWTALKQVADELSHASWIDPNLDVHVTVGLSSPSPLPGNLMLPDTGGADGSFSNLVMTDDPSQLVTRVYAKGFAVVSTTETINDTFASGTQRGQMSREPGHPITKYVSVTGGGSTGGWTVRRETVDGDSSITKNDYSAYVHQADRSIRFDPPLTASATVTYNPTIRPIWMVEDPVAQSAQAAIDGTDGVYEAMLHEPHMTGESLQLADARGRMLLAKYSYPMMGGTFNSILQGWAVGQNFQMTSAYRMGGLTNKTFYVVALRREIWAPVNGAPTLRYEVTFADRPFALF